MYAATMWKRRKKLKQNAFIDSGADLDLVGAEKGKREGVKTDMEQPKDLDVTDIQGNKVNIVGLEKNFIAKKPGGRR